MFGTLGFWQKEDVAPLRGEGNSATPAQSTIVTNVDYHCQHRWDYLKTIKKEATTEELVGDNKLEENNGKVEELAEDEAVEVDVVPEQHCCHHQQWSVLWAFISWSSWAHLSYIFIEDAPTCCMVIMSSLVMDVFAEVFDKSLPLLVMVFNKSDFLARIRN